MFDLVAKLSMVDHMTSPIKQISRQMEALQKATNYTRDANGKLRDEMGRFVPTGNRMSGAFGKATGSLSAFGGVGNQTKGVISEITKRLGIATTAAGAAALAFSSINKAMSFESQMSSIKALTGASGAEMAKMQQLALDMGAKTKYSALEAASGIEELLKAGLTPATVKAGGLEAALNLATAGGLDLAQAAEIMSTSMNSFSKDGMKAADAANILAGTANASATDVHDLQYSLSMVAAVASGAGLSLRDTSSALGVLANKGLKGSDAGTSLKTLLLQLQPTTKKQTKLFELLGLQTDKAGNSFYDANDHIKSMADIAGVLHEKFKNLTDGQRQAAFKEAFGTDAIRAANILYEAGTKGVKDFNAEMVKVTALSVAKEKMNNAAGAVEQFKGALETLQISVLLPLMPVIRRGATAMSDWMTSIKPKQVQQWGENIKNAGQHVLDFAKFVKDNWTPIRETIIAVTAAVVAFKVAMGTLMIVQTVTKLIYGLQVAYGVMTGAQWALNVAMDANPIGAIIMAIAALIGIGVLVYRNWDTIKAKAIELWGKMGNFKAMILGLLGPFGLLIGAGISLAKNWGYVKSVWSDVWGGIQRTAASAVNVVIDSINSMIETINKIPGVKIPVVARVDWGNVKAPSAGPLKMTVNSKGPSVNGMVNKLPVNNLPKAVNTPYTPTNSFLSAGNGHAGGLSYVPHDGYLIRAHRGEAVLTAQENKARAGGNGGTVSVSFAGAIFNVRGDADIEKIADQLAIKLREARELGAV